MCDSEGFFYITQEAHIQLLYGTCQTDLQTLLPDWNGFHGGIITKAHGVLQRSRY